MNYTHIEQLMSKTFHLRQRPVGMACRDAAPAGVPAFAGTEPSSCSFWRLAAQGQTFFTVPGDHYNCPIGSYTHNIALPADRAISLDQTLALMTEIGYIRMEEVPGIPRLPHTPGVIIYAPLGNTPVDPDAVLVAARPGNLMLLYEAAVRAGVRMQAPLFGRPTCMAVPAALVMGVVSSTGCVGNRIYTDLPEDELWMVVPGKDLAAIADQLETIAQANSVLTDYHRARRQTLASQ